MLAISLKNTGTRKPHHRGESPQSAASAHAPARKGRNALQARSPILSSGGARREADRLDAPRPGRTAVRQTLRARAWIETGRRRREIQKSRSLPTAGQAKRACHPFFTGSKPFRPLKTMFLSNFPAHIGINRYDFWKKAGSLSHSRMRGARALRQGAPAIGRCPARRARPPFFR